MTLDCSIICQNTFKNLKNLKSKNYNILVNNKDNYKNFDRFEMSELFTFIREIFFHSPQWVNKRKMWWLIGSAPDCWGGAAVPASSIMIRMRCRIIMQCALCMCNTVNLKEDLPHEVKKIMNLCCPPGSRRDAWHTGWAGWYPWSCTCRSRTPSGSSDPGIRSWRAPFFENLF